MTFNRGGSDGVSTGGGITLEDIPVDASAGTGSMRTLGANAGQALNAATADGRYDLAGTAQTLFDGVSGGGSATVPFIDRLAAGAGADVPFRVMSSPPTVATNAQATMVWSSGTYQQWQDAAPFQGADGAWYVNYATVAATGPIVAPSGQQPLTTLLLGSGFPRTTVVGSGSRTAIDTAINVQEQNRTTAQGPFSEVIVTDAPQIQRIVYARTPGEVRVRVDGEYTQLAPINLGGDAVTRSVVIDFTTTATPRKMRRVEIEYAFGCYPYGWRLGPTDSYALAPWRPTPRAYVVGDSFQAGPGVEAAGRMACQMLGFTDIAVDALGGTGYFTENGAATGGVQPFWRNFGDRVPLNIGSGKALPDVFVILGSVNDKFATTLQLQERASTLFNAIGTACPDAVIVAAVFGENQSNTANLTARAVALQATCAASSNVVAFRNFIPGLTGTGRLSTPTGLGNRDLMLKDDSTHPTEPAGQRWHARLIADLLTEAL